MTTHVAHTVPAQKPATAFAHRWWITCDLTSTSPLGIGDGSSTMGRIATPKNAENPPEINAIARNHKLEPFIPATGLKGAMRAVARNTQDDPTELVLR